MPKVIKVNVEALHNELNTSKGELWRWLHKKGERAVLGAKSKVGVRTGVLQRSIHMRHLGNATGQYLWIGSDRSHALAHHQGTRPHIITPTPPKKLLKFSKGGNMIYTHRVNHPGTKKNEYLSSQLRHFLTK